MSRTMNLDKHEMVIDKEDYEKLVKDNKKLLEACKRMVEYFVLETSLVDPKTADFIISETQQVIANAEKE